VDFNFLDSTLAWKTYHSTSRELTFVQWRKILKQENAASALILGASILLGLSVLGFQLAGAAIRIKAYERSVTVKGLSERELPADIVIWPIVFTEAGNKLGELYASIDDSTQKIEDFLSAKGINIAEITVSAPSITDKFAQQYNDATKAEFRFPPFKQSQYTLLKSPWFAT
jgi:uncharacterized protein